MSDSTCDYAIRCGTVKVVIREEDTEDGLQHQIRVCRIYEDRGERRKSETFGPEDLPRVAEVLDMAHSWIHKRKSR